MRLCKMNCVPGHLGQANDATFKGGVLFGHRLRFDFDSTDVNQIKKE